MGRLMNAEAESFAEKDIPPQLAELAETIGKKANATAVFGSPIVDGVQLSSRSHRRTSAPGGGDGFIAKGVGGGMTAKPLGFIVINKKMLGAFPKDPANLPSHHFSQLAS